MATTTDDPTSSRNAIRQSLARHAGAAPNASAFAKATGEIWQAVAAQLTPVIGARGVDALLDRAWYLASKSYPFLPTAGSVRAGSGDVRLSALQAVIEASGPAAAEVSWAVLATFTQLLASLIGAPLTDRLLAPVWTPPSAIPQQETAP